jgi:hypothetical protein
VTSGGYQLAGDGGGDGAYFSGSGMMQLDALLAHFAGVISSFDLADGLDLHSLGFGSSPSAMSWMQRTSESVSAASADGGCHIFSLALLGRTVSPAKSPGDQPRGAKGKAKQPKSVHMVRIR